MAFKNVVKVTCDLCGLEETGDHVPLLNWTRVTMNKRSGGTWSKDLCPDCAKYVRGSPHLVPVSPPESLDAMNLIVAERMKQIQKGYTAAHDDKHTDGSLTVAAGLVLSNLYTKTCAGKDGWWPEQLVASVVEKYPAPLKRLTIAGALVVAEIERELRRLNATAASK